MNCDELIEILYIGFPKSITIGTMEEIYNEIFDYLDNNEDVSLEILKKDLDYRSLDFSLNPPSPQAHTEFFYRSMLIEQSHSPNTISLNIHSTVFEDVCENLRDRGFYYDEDQDLWFR
ncbi:TPA: hypothetical protein ACGIK9_003259 [Acinetobacter baumannii]|uniref:hypothetical protein n=1 Tax=Acinetobacter baumannii TaxID=470 RepID=UPI0033900392